MIYDLFCDIAPIAAGIGAWIAAYNFFEVKYPPHDLRSSGPFKWQRRPVIIAWIVGLVILFGLGFLLA
jgi:hypothetical protein